MIMALFTLIVYLLVLGLLYWLAIYVIDTIPIPDPPARILKIGLMVIMVLIIVLLLLNMLGVGGDLKLPRLGT
jgi:hypothetical protein